MEKLLPVLMVVESFLAAGWYGWKGDWARAAYWVLGGGLTIVVTFWRMK